jgi:hypothetical protein
MSHAHLSRLRLNDIPGFLAVGYLTFLLSGCTSAPVRETPIPATSIHKDGRSAVYLQTVPDKSFRAAHPLKLEEITVEDILRGLHAEKKPSFTLLIGKALKNAVPEDARAFSEDDIAALAPHITAALAQATPNQRILFQVRNSTMGLAAPQKKGAPAMETTEGYLFADGLSINITLTEFGPGKTYVADTKAEPRVLPDPIGLHDREVKFTPEAAMREQSSWMSGNSDYTVSIDYQLMTKLLAAPPQPAPSATPVAGQPAQPTVTTAAPTAASDAEMQAVKEQLKAMQKKLDEQNAELQELKKSSTKKK